ncbi:hypothetical protein GLYMA_08G351500v4 [Glycine max]|uniref:FBD domain-containing protein n=1 Tax=Glycine max TaxID=3847 RepID=K7LAQ3_SOYBN|nr:hypothetical protein GLYMA_08G351500v4 [Glycine max]
MYPLQIHHEAYVPEFQNLTHIEFGYLDLERACERLKLLKVLEQCPKIEIAVIDQELCADDEGAEDWSYPQSVPGCISLQLKKCRLTNYVGSNDEFQFARNIMQNASHLQTMTICTNTSSNEAEKRIMIEIISLCTRDLQLVNFHLNSLDLSGCK